MSPGLTATVYTDRIEPDYFDAWNARGYVHRGSTWAVVEVGGLSLTAKDEEGIAGMQRLADALTSAIARAKQARQDADLTELVAS